MMNNDFGWKHLPCSFMRQNTVFMILTALIGNFFAFLVRRVAESGDFGIEANSRAKRFLFNFIQVPFRWTHSGRRWLLQIYSDRPYDKLKLRQPVFLAQTIPRSRRVGEVVPGDFKKRPSETTSGQLNAPARTR